MIKIKIIIGFLLPALMALGRHSAAPETQSNSLLISSEKIKTYTQADVRSYFDAKGLKKAIVPSRNGIDVYRILYHTTDIHKKSEQASGLFLVPQNAKSALPLLSYQHGTDLEKSNAPSISLAREFTIAMVFAADGYAVCVPDYLGLGLSPGFHPYMHAESEATSVIDLIRTVKSNCADFGIELNKQLFLTGYSQGGHATMAAHKVMERDFADEFTVTASAPLSGPYDLSGVQAPLIFGKDANSHIGYLPYLIFAYDQIYGLMSTPSDYFKAPFDTLLPPLFDGTHAYTELVEMIPRDPLQLIHDEIWNGFVQDEKNPFRMALADNNVYEWVPKTPVMMCYCKADNQVSMRNSIRARQWMKEKGAPHVVTKQASRKFGHRQCAYFAPAYAKFWFDGFRAGKANGGKGPIGKRFLLTVVKTMMKKNRANEASVRSSYK